jgi:hypothetical protein
MLLSCGSVPDTLLFGTAQNPWIRKLDFRIRIRLKSFFLSNLFGLLLSVITFASVLKDKKSLNSRNQGFY